MKSIFIFLSISLVFWSCKETPTEKPATVTEQLEAGIKGENTLEDINNEILNNPDSPNGYYKRAYYYKSIYEFANAITDINRALKLTPDVAALTFLKADILFNQAGATQNPLLYEQSEIYLLETLTLDSSHVEALVLESRINMGKPNLEKALGNLNSALLANKYYAPAYFWKAMIFEIQGEREKAKSSYQTAIEMDAKYYDALHHLANMYSDDLDPKAITFYNAALEVQPESFEVLRNKGLFLLNSDKYWESKLCFDQIIATDPNCEECYFNIGNTYIASYRDDMPKYSKDTTITHAIDNLQKAVALNGQYVNALYNLGLLYGYQNNKKKAIEYYQRVLEIEPMHEATMEALQSY